MNSEKLLKSMCLGMQTNGVILLIVFLMQIKTEKNCIFFIYTSTFRDSQKQETTKKIIQSKRPQTKMPQKDLLCNKNVALFFE